MDTAVRAVDELVPLVGASGFTAASPLAKTRGDLAGLRYADGIHDSLYRSGGRTILDTASEPVASVPPLPAPPRRDVALPATA